MWAEMIAADANEVVIAFLALAGIVVTSAVTLIVGLRRARAENRTQHRGVESVLGELVGKVDVIHTEVRDMRKDFTRHIEESH